MSSPPPSNAQIPDAKLGLSRTPSLTSEGSQGASKSLISQRWPAQLHGKVAIPRRRSNDLDSIALGAPSSSRNSRISHACEPCRLRKTKCSGEKPECSHCRAFRIKCTYATNKRDRVRDELQTLRQKLTQYELAFRRIAPSLDQANREVLTNAYPSVTTFGDRREAEETEASTPITEGDLENENEGTSGEDFVSAEVGSTGSIDHLNEDINSIGISSPEGYLGKTSDIDWIRKVFDIVNEDSSESTADNEGWDRYDPKMIDFEVSSYNLDDLELSLGSVDLTSMPPKYIADRLIDDYFETVHPSFPFLLEPLFRYQYDLFWTGYLNDSSSHWLAVFNIVLAISAIYAHRTKADHEGHELDHLQYYVRSKALEPDITVPGDVQHIQYTALLGLYLVCSNHLNQAYTVIGLAIRNGQGIGLHLRINRARLTDAQKEVRVRLWNSLYVLERYVCAMTGRPSAIADGMVSTPSPSANSKCDSFDLIPQLPRRTLPPQTVSLNAQYYVHEFELARILADVTETLYSIDINKKSWGSVLELIERLNNELNKWKANLTELFAPNFGEFDILRATDGADLTRMRTALAFQYYDVVRMANRPCLCRSDIPNESVRSKEATRNNAITCMQAGHRTLAMLPYLTPSPGLNEAARRTMQLVPWWNMSHYLMGSISAIVIGHLFDYKPAFPNEADVVYDVDKCLAWFQTFEEDDITSKRCVDIILEFKERVVHRTSPSLVSPQTSSLNASIDQQIQGMTVQSDPPLSQYPSSHATSIDQQVQGATVQSGPSLSQYPSSQNATIDQQVQGLTVQSGPPLSQYPIHSERLASAPDIGAQLSDFHGTPPHLFPSFMNDYNPMSHEPIDSFSRQGQSGALRPTISPLSDQIDPYYIPQSVDPYSQSAGLMNYGEDSLRPQPLRHTGMAQVFENSVDPQDFLATSQPMSSGDYATMPRIPGPDVMNEEQSQSQG